MVRFLHTSDWHAGRSWKGVSRLDELGAVLEHLGEVVERERVDVLLHSGDVFDMGAPPAEAERLVFSFFRRVGRAGAAAVVLAGNHDSPARLEAWGTLAELAGVTAVGRPRHRLVEVAARSGEAVRVAAVPFAHPRALLEARALLGDEVTARRAYAEAFASLVAALCAGFRPGVANVLLAHAHLEGALLSGSERAVHVEQDWAASAEAIPGSADYAGLGHLHRPQRVQGTGVPTFYAGSPLQLDFGEAGEEKGYLLVDVEPGQPTRATRLPYQGGRPLRKVAGSLAVLERDAESLRASGWLHVTVALQGPEPDVNGRVRRLLPNAVSVEVERPSQAPPPAGVHASALPPRALYAEYVRASRGAEPGDALLDAFDGLAPADGG
ncbi:MAG: exonuclease SbcCD subunit D [Deltaproteobacteria bacterium]|nr:exonuclease SbcCD subunit D [Deltaproteobacteria bacterium]